MNLLKSIGKNALYGIILIVVYKACEEYAEGEFTFLLLGFVALIYLYFNKKNKSKENDE